MKHTVYNACDLLDTASAKSLFAGRRLGLITNMSGVTRDLKTTSSIMKKQYDLCALFGPEHGIRGAAQAGGHDNEIFCDPETGVPVYDLFAHGEARQQAEAALSSLDAVVFDIQDIGVRYYTYQFAMLDAMRICKNAGVPFIVLDRINPLGGVRVEGNCIDADCTSGVGAVYGQPAVAGMTIGELALWFNDHMDVHADVQVLPCEGWRREMIFDDTDLLFVPPSPNMPTTDTVFLYPGTCFFEGTNLSEGRGTTKPFELFGAPWMEPERVLDVLHALPSEARETFAGIVFRPCAFTPTFHKHAGTLCGGLQLHVRDRASCDMYAAGLYLLDVLRKLYPEKCEFTRFLPHLVGTNAIMDADFDAASYLASQKSKIAAFCAERKPYLIYT